MTRFQNYKAAIACSVFCSSLLCAADFSTYRELQFGMNLAAAADKVGVQPSDAKLVHQRPAVIQELDWRLGSRYRAETQGTDPVSEVLMKFYNGELFQIVATYDRYKVEGLSEADMVEAISLTYGAAKKPLVKIAYESNYGGVADVIARWENADYSYNLVRTGNQRSFALILSSKRLSDLAGAAIVEAGRLDVIEAPQLAIDLQAKQEAESRLELEKARSVNMPNFRP